MYKSDFKTMGTHSYKSFTIEEPSKLSEYQLTSVETGDFDFLLPMTVEHKDSRLTMNYEIDSCKSLKKYIEDYGRLSKKQFLQLMGYICDVLLVKRQQLASDYFLISLEDIYFKRNQFTPKLMFLPHKDLKGTVLEQMKSLVLDLVPRKVKYAEGEALYNEILDIIDDEVFSIKSFQDTLNKFKEKEMYHQQEAVKKVKNSHRPDPKSMTSDGDNQQALKSNNTNYMSHDIIPETNVNEKETKTPEPSYALPSENQVNIEEKKGYSKLLVGLIQGITLLTVLLVYLTFTGDLLKVVGGSLAIITMDILMTYLIVKKGHEKSPEIKKAAVKRPEVKKATASHEHKNQEFLESNHYKTTFIDERVRLVNSRNKNDVIPIVISQNKKFKVGRNSSLDLTLDQGTVSYEHAEIITDGTNYYLEDLNSTNHTFLNGQKTIGSKKYPLKSGDSIAFADHEYIFYK